MSDETTQQCATYSNDDQDARCPTLRCSISSCPARASEDVEHPQRGGLLVCGYHAEEIRALPTWRFIGINEGERDHRGVIRR